MTSPGMFLAKRLTARALQKLIEEPSELHAAGHTLYRKPGSCLSSSIISSGLAAFLEPYIARSDSGAVVLWDHPRGYLILPPFPVEQDVTLHGWDLAPLKEIMSKQLVIGVVLIRLGRYAIGVYRGQTLISSKTESRYVHGRNRAGGSSQRRFERRRQKQIDQLFDKVCQMVRSHLTPYDKQLEHLFLGGEAHTIRSFLKHCDTIDHFTPRIRRLLLNMRSPNQASLEEARTEIWGGQVYVISEEPLP